MNKKDHKELEKITIMKLSMEGMTYREISKKLNVSLGYISKVIKKASLEAANRIESKWFLERIPYETEMSLLKLSEMDKIAWNIAKTSKDPRVILESLSRISNQDEKRRNILLSSEIIDRAIQAQKQQQLGEDIGNEDTSNDTSSDNESTNDDASENESISVSEEEDE